MKRVGKVFLVGAGPGDPGLLTVRGARLLEEADVIVMDALVDPRLVRNLRAKIIDAGKRGPKSENERAHGPSQSHINRLLIRAARSGKTVVRLKGGDPFVFGRGSEELEALRGAKISFEVVPGVTSASAVPAYAGIPITDRRWASQVTFVTGHERPGKTSGQIDWSRVSPDGTLVVLMGVVSWSSLSVELLSHGWSPATPVVAIERGATPRQRTIQSTLKRSARDFRDGKLQAPAVIVVGRVVALGGRLSWLSRERPLFGKRVVVTRAAESGDRFVAQLENEGADAILCPLIRVKPVISNELSRLQRATMSARAPFDWLIFLSGNAVNLLAELWPQAPLVLGHVPVVAVGPQTARAASAHGWRVKRVPSDFNSAAVKRALGSLRGKHLLLPRAQTAPADLVRSLERAGARVNVLPIYETEFVKPTSLMHRDILSGVDAVTFLSASSVEAFARAFSRRERKRVFRRAIATSIGAMTSGAVRRLLDVRPRQAKRSTGDGVIEVLRHVFAAN